MGGKRSEVLPVDDGRVCITALTEAGDFQGPLKQSLMNPIYVPCGVCHDVGG